MNDENEKIIICGQEIKQFEGTGEEISSDINTNLKEMTIILDGDAFKMFLPSGEIERFLKHFKKQKTATKT